MADDVGCPDFAVMTNPPPIPTVDHPLVADDTTTATTVRGSVTRNPRIDRGPMVERGEIGERDGADSDRLNPFGPAILAVRWATTGVSMALASPSLLDSDVPLLIWVSVVLANTVLRTFVPLRDTGSHRELVLLLSEIVLHVIAVIATGYWDSALVLLLINAVLIAGFARGFGFAVRVGIASALSVTVPAFANLGLGREQLDLAAQWTTLLLLGGSVAAYSRRISGEASRRHTMTLDRVARLADANTLLANLHRVAQTLPASLDQDEVLDSTVARLRSLIRHDSVAIVTTEELSGIWNVARQKNTTLSGDLRRDDLPAPALRALATQQLVAVDNVSDADRSLHPDSRAGMYVPLLARGRLIGLTAVETKHEDGFEERDAQVLQGFVEPMALAIDNARWFRRIRTVGADEERTRIARDLHDRIGQSLAYLGFEIDRLTRRNQAGEPMDEHLKTLRESVRAVIVEVRDTLSDLRTDVTDQRDFAETAGEFAERLAERSGLTIELDCDTDRRLPILQEREMWRIAQEALVNVERHAEATTALLRWRCDANGASLEVSDNGKGLPAKTADGQYGRTDSYGIVGMRERADSVGATLELTSKPGEGTKVWCFLAQR